jgi:hypothetical protein
MTQLFGTIPWTTVLTWQRLAIVRDEFGVMSVLRAGLTP